MDLLEREAELEVIAAAVAAARDGDGSVVLIEGPAGIGKSTLLATAPRTRDVRWLDARGGELERDLPLGVARELLEPALFEADARLRARLLEGTGPAATALEARIDAGDGDAAALLRGLHRLVRNLAAESPLVLEVDDVQWADAASLRFLAFLARRIRNLPALLLLARRSGEPPADEAALRAIAAEPFVQRLEPASLSLAAVAELVEVTSGRPPDEDFSRACHDASGGNPFVLRELLTALAQRGIAPDVKGTERVARLGPPSVGRWVLDRLEQLPPSAGQLARAVAVLGEHADLGRAARLGGLQLDDAGVALDALIEIDLLRPGRPPRFVHPVVRAAVHDAMLPGERSSAHRAAARLLIDQAAPPGTVAIHLLGTEPGGEGWVADALLTGAQVALGQGAPEVAAAYVERALSEPAPLELRPPLLRALGNAERRLGLATADERFIAAYEDTGDLRERAEILLDMVITGNAAVDAISLLRQTADELAPVEPELALITRARLLVASDATAEPTEPYLRDAEAALAAHSDDTLGGRLLAAALAFHKALRAEPRPQVVALATRAIGDDDTYRADLDAGYPHIYAIGGLSVMDVPELPERRLSEALARAQERGSLVGAAIALFYRAHLRRRTGELAAAMDDARAALQYAVRTTDDWLVAMSASPLIEALVERGELDEAQALLEQHADLTGRLPPGPPLGQLTLARSAFRLATGDPGGAHVDATSAGRDVAEAIGARHPIIAPWRSRAALALVALGRSAEAHAIAEEGLAISEQAEVPSAIGAARRVLAATTAGDEQLTLLNGAVAVLESAPAPLELARALTDLGAALRRAGRRRDAREPLARALELAHRHGATPLAAAARTELRASGARPRREVRTGVDALTPSERRVAELAAAGLSNAEIAARLYVTPKTTEHHLSATYRKLNIASRRQLAALLDPADSDTAQDSQLR